MHNSLNHVCKLPYTPVRLPGGQCNVTILTGRWLTETRLTLLVAWVDIVCNAYARVVSVLSPHMRFKINTHTHSHIRVQIFYLDSAAHLKWFAAHNARDQIAVCRKFHVWPDSLLCNTGKSASKTANYCLLSGGFDWRLMGGRTDYIVQRRAHTMHSILCCVCAGTNRTCRRACIIDTGCLLNDLMHIYLGNWAEHNFPWHT